MTPEQIESLVKEIDPKAKLEGDELVLLNPQRRDRTRKSFKINRVSGIWKDFAAGKGGADVVGFWAYCKGIPYDQAAKELALRFGTEAPKSHEQPKDNLLFIPMHEIEGYQAPMRGRAKPSKVWTYCDQQGRPLFQRPRWDFVKADGKADKVVTWWGVFEDAKGKLEWMQKAPPTPRPLYGLPDLQDPKRDQGVLVVEGEKTADAARALFSKLAIVTSGASDSAKTTDWSPLAGRDVVLWPDHDQPGLDYAEAVAAQLKPLGVELRVVDVPNFFPQKWDLADPLPNGATRDTLVEMIDHAQLQSVVEPVTITHRLEARTWNDFQSRTFTEQEWLCEPLFPKVSIGLVASGPGHGKTTTMIQLAVSLATGLPFMGMPVCGPCGIGLLLLEDNENLIHGRLQAQVTRYGDAITAEHERKLDVNLRVMIERAFTTEELNDPNLLDLKLSGLAGELAEKMKDTEDPPGLLVIDTLNAVHDGEESSSTETRPLIAALRKLHLSLGASVYVTHHYRKMGVGKAAPALVDRMDPELIRGSSAIHAGARAVVQFAMVSKADADKAGIKDWEDPQQYAVVGLTKNNGGRKSKWMLWEHTDGGLLAPVEDGESLIKAMLGSTTAPKKTLTQQDRVLMEIHTLDGGPLDRAAMAKDLGFSLATLRSVLSRLLKAKLVTKKNTLTATGRIQAEALLGSPPRTSRY